MIERRDRMHGEQTMKVETDEEVTLFASFSLSSDNESMHTQQFILHSYSLSEIFFESFSNYQVANKFDLPKIGSYHLSLLRYQHTLLTNVALATNKVAHLGIIYLCTIFFLQNFAN